MIPNVHLNDRGKIIAIDRMENDRLNMPVEVNFDTSILYALNIDT